MREASIGDRQSPWYVKNEIEKIRKKIEAQRILVKRVTVSPVESQPHQARLEIVPHELVRDEKIIEFVRQKQVRVVKWKHDDDILQIFVEIPLSHGIIKNRWRRLCLNRFDTKRNDFDKFAGKRSPFCWHVLKAWLFLLVCSTSWTMFYSYGVESSMSFLLLSSFGALAATVFCLSRFQMHVLLAHDAFKASSEHLLRIGNASQKLQSYSGRNSVSDTLQLFVLESLWMVSTMRFVLSNNNANEYESVVNDVV
jgi:hypothetical protein